MRCSSFMVDTVRHRHSDVIVDDLIKRRQVSSKSGE